jgi:nitronate monooxygenase
VRATGAKIVSSATTVEEAVWLERAGCDAIVAQGAEAGGHRGMFLSERVEAQVGILALVPQVVDAVSVPVIAAGGIADGAASPPPSRSAPARCRSAPPTSSAPSRR